MKPDSLWNSFNSRPAAPGIEPQPGWQAELRLGFERIRGKTVLAQRRHSGPLTVQRPFYPEGGVCHVYLLHPPGGIVAGDRLAIAINAAVGSAVLLTTPAAGKFYRSNGDTARQSVSLSVAPGAALEWLPQETIVYEGARASSDTHIELAAGARFIGWDILVLGRPAANEGFASGEVMTAWRIDRAGEPFYRERLRLDAQGFAARWGLAGHCACGSLFAYPAGGEQLTAVQRLIAADYGRGATLIDGLLVFRALDHRVDRLRERFERVWRLLRPAVLNRPACPPRIWAT